MATCARAGMPAVNHSVSATGNENSVDKTTTMAAINGERSRRSVQGSSLLAAGKANPNAMEGNGNFSKKGNMSITLKRTKENQMSQKISQSLRIDDSPRNGDETLMGVKHECACVRRFIQGKSSSPHGPLYVPPPDDLALSLRPPGSTGATQFFHPSNMRNSLDLQSNKCKPSAQNRVKSLQLQLLDSNEKQEAVAQGTRSQQYQPQATSCPIKEDLVVD